MLIAEELFPPEEEVDEAAESEEFDRIGLLVGEPKSVSGWS